MREPRLCKLQVILSDDEMQAVQRLAGGLPLSPFVRTLLLRLDGQDDLAEQLRERLRVALPPAQPIAQG